MWTRQEIVAMLEAIASNPDVRDADRIRALATLYTWAPDIPADTPIQVRVEITDD